MIGVHLFNNIHHNSLLLNLNLDLFDENIAASRIIIIYFFNN